MGWRDAYACLGALTLLVGLPMALVLTRHIGGPRTSPHAVPVLPLVRTRRFASICIVFVLLGIITVGTLVHLVPLMTGRGLSPAAAATVAGLTGLTSLLTRGGAGWVLDHVPAPRVLAAATLSAVTALLLLGLGVGHGGGDAAAILLGCAIGAEVDCAGYLIRRSFPPAVFGRLYGLLFVMFTLGTGTGPIIMGLSFDRLGSYRPGLLLFAALGLVAAATVLTIPKDAVAQVQA